MKINRNTRFIIIITLLSLVSFISAEHKWDDARVNILGNGWDIIENEPREAIFVLESPAHADPDKRIETSTLPKGVVMRNIPKGTFHFYASVIDQNRNIEDTREIKVDGGVKFWKIKGSFNTDSKVVKKFVSKRNHKVTRVYSTITTNEFQLQTSRLPLSDGIKNRIDKIDLLLQKNTRESNSYAIYLIDQVLNLFGTHIIIEEKVGGILSKIDAVDISGMENSVDQTLSASASASFGTYFNIKGSIKTEHSDVQKYHKSVTDTYIKTLGGDPWKPSDDKYYDKWVDTLSKNPASVGVKAIYLLDILREQYFPKFSYEQIAKIRKLFEDRLDVYLKNNYYKGCADPTASNYVSYANVFDPKLCNYQKSFHFGGMFTKSSDKDYSVPNILTEKFSCPSGYKAHLFLTEKFNSDTVTNTYCHKECHHKWFKKKCRNKCHDEYWNYPIEAKTYVCISHKEQTKGMYFGGVHTNSIINDITQGKSCPQKYIAFPIYHNSKKSDPTYVCMAPYDSGSIVSVPFGGIFSSQNSDYMVGNKPVCGPGFERHAVGPRPIAEITYCIGIGSLKDKTKDRIPPGYGGTPSSLVDYYTIYKKQNGTNVSVRVNPLNKDNYVTQVTNLAKGVIPIVEPNKDSNKRLRIGGQNNCYLEKWMVETGLYGRLVEQYAFRKKEGLTKNKPTKIKTIVKPTVKPVTKPTKNEPTKSEPTKSEPTKNEPTKSEPTKSEPTKNEPTKNEPTNDNHLGAILGSTIPIGVIMFGLIGLFIFKNRKRLGYYFLSGNSSSEFNFTPSSSFNSSNDIKLDTRKSYQYNFLDDTDLIVDDIVDFDDY